MSEPNVVRELAAGLDNAPELSEADYEAMERKERDRILEQLLAEERRLWAELIERKGECEMCNARRVAANNAWSEAFTKWREASEKWGLWWAK